MEPLVFIVSHMDHNSTIWAKCRDLVLNLTVHTTSLQRTSELPFAVSQTAYIKTGVIYIFYDTCSNFNVFFQYKIQDDDNLLLALCGWTSSCLLTSLKNTRIYYIVFQLCFQNVQACQNYCHFFVSQPNCSLCINVPCSTAAHSMCFMKLCVVKSHCLFLNTYSTTVFLV